MGSKKNSKANENQTEIDFSKIPAPLLVKPSKPRKQTQSRRGVKGTAKEFWSKSPAPTRLEECLFVAGLFKTWTGKPCDLVRAIRDVTGYSASTVYKLMFIGNNIPNECVSLLKNTEWANHVSRLSTISHLETLEEKIQWASRQSHVDPLPILTSILGSRFDPVPLPRAAPAAAQAKKSSKLANDETRVLAREDYHKIARIMGAQNQEIYLKIKEIISEYHKSELKSQVEVAQAFNHTLKKLQEICEKITGQQA